MDNIYLTGFMGSGKSTVARLVSQVLGITSVDMDKLIVDRLGMPVSEIFENLGQDTFRKNETRILETLAKKKNLVVATGGGVCESPENRKLMSESGTSIFLDATLESIKKRLGNDEIAIRPLWKNPSEVEELFQHRVDGYRDSEIRIDVEPLTPTQVCAQVCNSIFPKQEFIVDYEGYKSRVVACWDAPDAVNRLIQGKKVAVLTDHNVEKLHLPRFMEVFNNPVVISLKAGEKSKSTKSADQIYRQLLDAKIGRGDLLVALGGGVVTDIGGFVASTFKRGIDFILVGTSMVAGVDAAIGGKSAIDVGNIKNSVGLFTKPALTVLDLTSLHTLRTNQIKEGLIEAYKTGLVADRRLSVFISENIKNLLKGSVIELSEVVVTSARAKCEIVSKDFRERDLRRILNLGHTYGHAVESFNNYAISHGKAVSIGLLAALNISRDRGLIGREFTSKTTKTIKEMFSSTVKLPTASQAWQIMLNDKKNKDGKISFVLLRDEGKCEVVNDVTESELDSAITKI